MTKLVIPAKNFRRFEDPFADGTQTSGPTKYRFYARVADVPEELLEWMDTNPRDQNLKTDTAKAIIASLENDSVPYFHLWNRGILISADRISYDNRSGNAEIYLDTPTQHGNIDGGHTLRIIIECQRKVAIGQLEKMPNQYVEIEVIVGLDSPEGLAEARNTSVAVDLKSMEELRKSFNTLKAILDTCYIDGEHYIDRIEFHQNQMRSKREKNPIDIREVISILNMFNLRLYPNTRNSVHPIQSFSGKEVGLERFLRAGLDKEASDEMCREEREKLLGQMANIIPDIFLLWDTIERHFTDASEQLGKRYGRKKYSNYDKDKRPPALFSNAQLNYSVPRGILYPLVGAFRALVEVDENSQYTWAVPPQKAWEDTKADLVAAALATSEELANNPANIGRSPNLWNSVFMTLYVYTLENKSNLR